MLKNLLTISFIIFAFATIIPANANTTENNNQNISIMYKNPNKEQMRKQFEQRLNLSEKQKTKAHAIHQKGLEEMKPLMMKLEEKKQEKEMVKYSRMSEQGQKDRINQLNSEIAELEKQAKEVRKKNSQDFEKILNKNQKAELELMKAEGRAKFEKYHPARTPFQGLGTPNFLIKPLIQPQHDNWKK